MFKEGDLVIRIEAREGRVTRAVAEREKAQAASELLVGRPAREAAPLIRSLFATCGLSHAVAAHVAVETARETTRGSRRAIRERRIIADTLQHHAWRMFVDIPRVMGREADIDIRPEERKALGALVNPGEGDEWAASRTILGWSHRALLGCQPREFLGLSSMEAFEGWTRSGRTPAAKAFAEMLADEPGLGANDVALLPFASNQAVEGIATALERDDQFVKRPQLEGKTRETGPLSRNADHPLVSASLKQWGNGFGSRLVARLVETADLLCSLSDEAVVKRHGAFSPVPGHGVGWAEVGNGLAVHSVEIDDGKITAYRTLVPADWNFHPEGAFSRGAEALKTADPRITDARLRRVAASLDPGFSLRFVASAA